MEMGLKRIVHDYAGHPFQLDLSRELARRGHVVIHAYFVGDAGQKGDLNPSSQVNKKITIRGVKIRSAYKKTSFIKRRFHDVEYGRTLRSIIQRERPDVVISGNTPTEAQEQIRLGCARYGVACIHWVQDFYSVAVTHILKDKFGFVGSLIGKYYTALERRQLRRADEVIVITRDFVDIIRKWGVNENRLSVIENWGPISHVEFQPKHNAWSYSHGVQNDINFVYTGTLALKHNPALLIELAKHMSGRACVLAVCQGVGIVEFEQRKASNAISNLTILPIQPYPALPLVLATADVLIATIEPGAGLYSVPSKVLSYFCASRPVLISAPNSNLAAQLIEREDAGLVADPADVQAFLDAADRLVADVALRERLGSNGRRYAERAFDITKIATTFELVIKRGVERRKRSFNSAQSEVDHELV